MLKLTAVVSLMLIANWSHADPKRHKKEATASGNYEPGNTIWAGGLSCDSCGSECASACGTRQFRSCCFNYLRRKRGPDHVTVFPQNPHDVRLETQLNPRMPVFVIENIPEPWMTNVVQYPLEDGMEKRLPIVFDA